MEEFEDIIQRLKDAFPKIRLLKVKDRLNPAKGLVDVTLNFAYDKMMVCELQIKLTGNERPVLAGANHFVYEIERICDIVDPKRRINLFDTINKALTNSAEQNYVTMDMLTSGVDPLDFRLNQGKQYFRCLSILATRRNPVHMLFAYESFGKRLSGIKYDMSDEQKEYFIQVHDNVPADRRAVISKALITNEVIDEDHPTVVKTDVTPDKIILDMQVDNDLLLQEMKYCEQVIQACIDGGADKNWITTVTCYWVPLANLQVTSGFRCKQLSASFKVMFKTRADNGKEYDSYVMWKRDPKKELGIKSVLFVFDPIGDEKSYGKDYCFFQYQCGRSDFKIRYPGEEDGDERKYHSEMLKIYYPSLIDSMPYLNWNKINPVVIANSIVKDNLNPDQLIQQRHVNSNSSFASVIDEE